jgi:hypothetical protein
MFEDQVRLILRCNAECGGVIPRVDYLRGVRRVFLRVGNRRKAPDRAINTRASDEYPQHPLKDLHRPDLGIRTWCF